MNTFNIHSDDPSRPILNIKGKNIAKIINPNMQIRCYFKPVFETQF